MKTRQTNLNLPADYALVLQQIVEDGEDDVVTLERTLNFNRVRLWTILKSLQSKGLILINNSYDDAVICISRKGSQLAKSIWPDSTQFAS